MGFNTKCWGVGYGGFGVVVVGGGGGGGGGGGKRCDGLGEGASVYKYLLCIYNKLQ